MYGPDVDAVRFVTEPLRRMVKVEYEGLHPRTALPVSEDIRALIRPMKPEEVFESAVQRRVRRNA